MVKYRNIKISYWPSTSYGLDQEDPSFLHDTHFRKLKSLSRSQYKKY
jgi:hypothetical protein